MSDLRRRRLRKARRSRQRKTQRNVIIALSAAAFVGGALLVSALAVNSVGDSLRDGELKEIKLGQNTRIYDKNGKEAVRVSVQQPFFERPGTQYLNSI